MKPKMLIHLKPFMIGVGNLKPTYGISKIITLGGELVYVAHDDNITYKDPGDPLYILRRWVQKREVVS